MKDRPVVLIWGIGPSYRKRVITTIKEAIDSGYDNIMDYIVLTDVPEDFYKLQDKSKKILDIVNIHKEREKYPWSIENEYIPTNQKTYGDDFRNNAGKGIHFSHGLDRFSLDRGLDLGYNKLLMHDPDVKLYYKEIVKGNIKETDFWKEFDTAPNTMKSSVPETIKISHDKPFEMARCMGSPSLSVLQYITFLLYKLNEKFNEDFPILHTKLDVSESALKYFHFSSIDYGKKYFKVLNELARLCYGTPRREDGSIIEHQNLKWMHGCTGTMHCDFIPYATANLFMGIKVRDFKVGEIYNCYVFGDDRYFIPPMGLKIGKTQKEFYELNKDRIHELKTKYQWPNLTPDHTVISDLKESSKSIFERIIKRRII